jgi:hypothetical protein
MKTKTFLFLFLLVASSSAFLTSCNKDDIINDPEKATTVDQNLILAESTFNDIGNLASSSLSGKGDKLKSSSGCLVVTFDLTASPYKMTLDFGTANCLCEDGLYRRGKIIVAYTTGIGDSLASLSTTFNNFFVNDNKITGTHILTYKGHNQAGHSNWDISVNGAIELASGEGTITYIAAHNSEMIAGEATPIVNDNVFSNTGSSSGTAITGQAFTSVITTPLVNKTTCGYFVSGVVEISPAAQPKHILNFGTGDCDNKATVTISGITFEITLP